MSIFLSRHGAVDGTGIDAGVASHYGDPHREQVLLAEGLAAVDLSHRGVITIAGADRLTWLHSLTTQHLNGLTPHTSTESLILTPKGKVEHALHIVDDGEKTWITTEPGAAAPIVEWLDTMRFMLRVELEDVSGAYAVLGEPIGLESVPGEPVAWVDPWPRLVGDTFAYGPPVEEHPAQGWQWRELIVPVADVEAALGDRPLSGTWASEALRVAAWRPRAGVDTDERAIPHELDWLRTAVHLHKGCYRGQETVARVKNLGRPPRRLVFLHLDGSGHVLPDPGTELLPVEGGRAVGHLTSVARHHEDGPIALALIKRNTDPEMVLLAEHTSAAQTVIVPSDTERRPRRVL
ncbi:MAG: glycine cleavage T C-terminal barrel domain-containing protein [Ornithinimicrobium sp.]|uniref:CAF17-like 4Fe-4S cluster assembly/insertion protein YgfZ n=1 Tax=Ornithinimicrobium sp. TaxID=1977084 RepID=UPI0026E10BD9|nr:glycine cleavage T C-terminal barrel domain-containing protein [Ornithinimicrobium sp.]MDO5740261.1 glycine cleavage T C-terminal barrel domain-containing protein [Ornithinimicrobium sp.]